MASYNQLVNQDGTIFNQGAKVAYSTPDQLAADLGTTANNIQWGQIAQAGAGFNPTGYAGYTPPNTSAPVPGANLTSGNVNLPSGTPPNNGQSMVAGIVAGATPAVAPEGSATPALDMAGDYSQDKNVQNAQAGYDKAQTDLANYNLPSQADEYTKLMESSGANADLAQVKQLREQLASEVAAYNNDIAQTETKGIQSGVPALFWQGEAAAKQRQASILTAGTAARLQAAQGNYELATKTVDKMVDLRYLDAQNKLDKIRNFVNLNKENLSKSESLAIKKMETKATQEQKKLDEEKAKVKENLNLALVSGTKTKFINKNGEFFDTNSGVPFSDANSFFRASGVKSFEEAYQKGIITDLDNQKIQDIDFALQAQAKYNDVRIPPNSTPDQVKQLINGSRIYQDQVRGPVGSGGGGVIIPGDNPQLYAGLSTPTATAVRAQVGAFKTEPLVQNFATIQDGYNFASSISGKTQNPADDQALIYSLAKALDPGSVVREGEYATAQKYSQSWIKAYGKGAEQALAGTGFLSEQARSNIKTTIESKYQASKKSYDNLAAQYANSIGTLTGRGDGSAFLKSYVTPQATDVIPSGTDGESYGFPGYVSDGTQWVAK